MRRQSDKNTIFVARIHNSFENESEKTYTVFARAVGTSSGGCGANECVSTDKHCRLG